ncbi:MFS transporter superfamily [Fusarium oxysporum f. sp. vasinfectum]|nr:MFS transporter superfamily [Fusarium oxysporum f. sp. vasinfectum]
MQSLLQFRRLGDAAEANVRRGYEQVRQAATEHSAHCPNVDLTHLTTFAPHTDTPIGSASPPEKYSHPSDKDGGLDNDPVISTTPNDKPSHGLDAVSRVKSNGMTVATASGGIELARSMAGINIREGSAHPELTGPLFIVSWEGPDDSLNPRNWSVSRRVIVTLQVGLISTAVGAASGIDATALPQAAEDFDVSEVVESLATGLYLIGIGAGSLFAGPFSETFGRNAVYIGSMLIFSIWIMGAGLSPNIGAQLAFRFLAGCCGSTPIVCCGGSVADLWDSLEKTWSFPIYTTFGFGGSILGAIIGAYIAPSETLSWRWVEWIILIFSGFLLLLVLLTMPETYGPVLLHWRASHYRRITGDSRFYSEHELTGATFLHRLQVSMTRPFLMLTEPIIMAMTLYITVLYIILFTFLVGWPYIFEKTYGINQGLTNTIFVAMFVGMQFIYILIPFIYRKTARAIKQSESPEQAKRLKFSPELRLWYAMLGTSIAIPVSLFWMGWTATPNISIWSPIIASSLFGFGTSGVFICTYLYIIDSYEAYSASALTFASLVRYVAAGGMTIVGIPFYENMGTNYTLTIMACLSLVLVPIPYILYKYGHHLREKSKYAVSWD